MDIKNSKIKITTNFEKFIENLEIILEANCINSVSHLDFDQAKFNLKNLYDSIVEYQNLKLTQSISNSAPQNSQNQTFFSNNEIDYIENNNFDKEIIQSTEQETNSKKSIEVENQPNLSFNNETHTKNLDQNDKAISDFTTNNNEEISEANIENGIEEINSDSEINTTSDLNIKINDIEKTQIENNEIAESIIKQEIIESNQNIEESTIIPKHTKEIEEPIKIEVLENSAEIIETEQPKILSDKFTNNNSSIYDRLQNNKEDLSLGKKLQNQPLSDLRKAIGINDRFSFINELFEGKKDEFDSFLNRVIEINELSKLNILIEETSATKNWTSKASFNKFSSILSRYIQSK